MEMHTAVETDNQVKTDSTLVKRKLEGDELVNALKKQIMYYFSLENLQNDTYLVSQMNSEMYVPIKVISGFKMLKNLTEDVELITTVLRTLPDLTVDEQGLMVKPNLKVPRTTLIFREVPQDTQEYEIEEFLTKEGCKKPASIKSDIGQTWFVQFETEEDALKAFEVVRNTVFKGQSVHVRYKTEKTSKILPATAQPFYPKSMNYTPNYLPSGLNPVSSGWNHDQNRRRHNGTRPPRKDYSANQKIQTPRRDGENQNQNQGLNSNQTQYHYNQGHYQNHHNYQNQTHNQTQGQTQAPVQAQTQIQTPVQTPTQTQIQTQTQTQTSNQNGQVDSQRGRPRTRPRNTRNDGQRQESHKPQSAPIKIDGLSFPPLPGVGQKGDNTGSNYLPKQYSHVAVAVADKPLPKSNRRHSGHRSSKPKQNERTEEDKENIKSEEKGENNNQTETVTKEVSSSSSNNSQTNEEQAQSLMSYAQILKSMNSSPSSSSEKSNEEKVSEKQQQQERSSRNERQSRNQNRPNHQRSDRSKPRDRSKDNQTIVATSVTTEIATPLTATTQVTETA